MSSIKNCQKVPITDVLSFIVDNRGKTVPTADKGIPLIATNCILNEHLYPTFDKIRFVSKEVYDSWFRAYLEPNDILFVNKGTPGRCCLVPDPVIFCAAQDMIGLRCDSTKIYYRYLLMVLRAPSTQKFIENYHVGVAIPHFKKDDLPKLEIPLPDMGEQIELGDFYFDLCTMIESNNKISAELESLAKTIYNYWFLQFEFPNEEGKPYKSSGGKMVYNEELKREIPDGWEVKPFSEIGNFIMGQSPKGDNYNLDGKGLPLLNGAVELTEHGIEINKYSDEFNRSCAKGDWLFCVRATLGNINKADREYCLGRGVASVTPIEERWEEYVYFVLSSMIDYFKKSLSGSIIVGMVKDDIVNYPVILPDERTIGLLHSRLSSIFKKRQLYISENHELASLRDWLLPMLMNGQVTFKETA